ncbi:AMP-binding protein [Croceicoccus sp. F390]|uniref:AMP-binding protein n=1 Tax=Croceicoccus esteveae TaxID=3075597 RepID=A0ABU2ZHD3_9SPHN|nr:AMP-binding protein [Croceicoccus sp. F390]MDT0576012.1 AMP-binding protein [Croceicoccus sp. F390]
MGDPHGRSGEPGKSRDRAMRLSRPGAAGVLLMARQFHLADLFETIAATVPDRIAIISDSLTLTYAQLDRRANSVAAGLAARGVTRGDNVGLFLTNRAEHLEAFIAVIKLGAVPFNVNYRYREDELRQLFADARAAAIIHDAQFGPVVRNLSSDLPSLKTSVAVDDGSGADCSASAAYADLLQTDPDGAGSGDTRERSEDDILLTYTGGTTGFPKGVMWPHKAFVFACAGGGGHFNPTGPLVEPADAADRAATGYPLRMMPVAPLMHAAAVWAVWSAMLNGLTIVIDEGARFDAERIWTKVAEQKVNIVQVVGDAMAVPLRDALRDNPGRWNLAHVVNFGSGGAVFSRQVQADLQSMLPGNAKVTDGMGASETGVSGQAMQGSEGLMRLPSGPDQQVVIDGRLAHAGEIGFVARSGHTPVGYFGDAAKTEETFRIIGDRLWAVSGDTARLDEDGMITVFGRGSTCINSGGEKIYPEEVEEALRAHPAVFDAVVVGKADERWGEKVVAIASLREGAAAPELTELRSFLSEKLAGYKLPRALVWTDAVERSPAGKQNYRWAKELAAKAEG